jgi:hypothetical protein
LPFVPVDEGGWAFTRMEATGAGQGGHERKVCHRVDRLNLEPRDGL